MPGTFILKPIEAHIHGDTELKSNRSAVDAYCKIKVGDQKAVTHPSEKLGTHPVWNDDLVIQQGEKSQAKLVLKDKHSEKKIGKVKFDLNEVKEKGKINRWFDVYKHNQVQGKIHLDMIYTSGNHQSQSFHRGIKEGAAIQTSKPSLENLERFQRHSELESTKFMLSTGMSNPNNVMFGRNANVGHTGDHGFGHHDNLIREREHRGPNGEIDLRYTNDATLKDLKLTGNPANTGMSNPNTAKLGINHKEGPFGVKNLYNENAEAQKNALAIKDAPKVVMHSPQKVAPLSNASLNEASSVRPTSNPNTLGLGDENLKGLRKSSYNMPSNNYLGDPFDVGTHNNTRRPHRKSEDLGFGGTEMSNPNNAKYHVNQNIGHTGPTNFHQNVATNEQLGPIDARGDVERLSSRLSERPSFSGMSNPNNAGVRRFY